MSLPEALYWVGHERSFGDKFKGRIERMNYVDGVYAGGSYEYDDLVVIELDAQYYAFRTSGCSCPSPDETASIEIGPVEKAEIISWLQSEQYSGPWLPEGELDGLIKAAMDYQPQQ